MIHRKSVLLLFLSILWLPAARAQDNHKNELGLLLGGAKTQTLNITAQSGTNVEFGTGFTFQATYARRLASLRGAELYFEVPFLAAPQVDITSPNGTVPANFASLFITPGLRVKLVPDARVSPWLALGGGYANFDESAERVDGSPNTGSTGSHRGAVQFGGGIDLRTPIKVLFPIGLRVEVRDVYSGKPNYNVDTGGGFQHNLVFSGGLVLHF